MSFQSIYFFNYTFLIYKFTLFAGNKLPLQKKIFTIMAGIYIHVPFCKTRCAYCDFYSSTLSELKSHYLEALCHELAMRHN